MYYKNIIKASIVTVLCCTASIWSLQCGMPIGCLLSNNSDVDGIRCGGPYSPTSSKSTVDFKLSFPSRSQLTLLFTTNSWLTELSICNSDTSNISTYSFAYSTHTDAQLSPVRFASLYNSSLPSGALVHLERGESRRIKLQNPIQPETIVIFGYGSFGSEGYISVQLFGCFISNFSYPFTSTNLLQYSFPDTGLMRCTSSSDQVEKGIVYGNDGPLVDGVKSFNSSDYTNCLTWNSSELHSLFPLTFSLYQAASIQTIKIYHLYPIINVTIHSPGTLPETNVSLSNTTTIVKFTTSLVTDYIRLVLQFEDVLSLSELQMYSPEGVDIFKSPVYISQPAIPGTFLTPLIATTSTLSSLLLTSVFTILILVIILCRSQRNLSVLIRFYDTLTPDSLAVYSTIKRTPKSRDYVNMVRFYNDMLASQQESTPKSSQPLPTRPRMKSKCTSETSSLALGDYERVGPVLAEHESTRNSSSAMPLPRSGLTLALSNSLTFFNRSKCAVKPAGDTQEDNIIYDSAPQSPAPSDSHTRHLTGNMTNLDSRYSVRTASYLEPAQVTIEDFKPTESIPLSVSNNHLYKLAGSLVSPSQPHATFHFTEDSDFTSPSNAKHLAGITLSQLDDSISSDSV